MVLVQFRRFPHEVQDETQFGTRKDSWTERLRRVVSDRAIGGVGGQVYPFDPAGMRRPVGTSTKGDHHVAIT
jgi:hypothetical protein